MKLLVFEFATATGLDDPSITVEGRSMLEAVLNDLKELKPYYLISEGDEMDSPNQVSVPKNEDFYGWLNKHIQNYDACLPIVPEEDQLLYDLTRIIEDNGVKVMGSDSKAVSLTTNKFEMYTVLNGNFPVITTEKIFFDDDIEEFGRSAFKQTISKVVKPADGVSCSGVMVVNSIDEFLKAVKSIKQLTKLPYFIMQDYIPGESVSVSLLSNGETAVPISLNLQKIGMNSGKIIYRGGKVPLNHKMSKIAKETAKEAVEVINGIVGYVGVDLIIGDEEVHLVEINSRLTTPYVALRKIINLNLAMAVINAVDGKLPENIGLNGEVNFYKEGNALRVSVLK